VAVKVRVVDGDAHGLTNVLLALHRLGAAASDVRTLQADGTAKFPPMASGRYAVVLGAPQAVAAGPHLMLVESRQFYLKSMTARNARVVDGFVEVPETGTVQLEILAGGDGAHVKGRVRAAGKPVSAALVVLAPRQGSKNPDDYHSQVSGSDGSFSFDCVKPGEYTLFATDNWLLEYGNPEAVGPYLAAGTPVKAEPNATVEVQLEPAGRERTLR
jgi:hypothetical protein